MNKLALVIVIALMAIAVVFYYLYLTRYDVNPLPQYLTADALQFKRIGYAALEAAEFTPGSKFTIEFDIRTSDVFSFVAMLGDPAKAADPTKPFLSFWIDAGYLSVIANQSYGRVELKSLAPVNVNAWTGVKVEYDTGTWTLSVNDVKNVSASHTFVQADVIQPSEFRLGGMEIREGGSKSLIGMHGCIRHVTLDGIKKKKFRIYKTVDTNCA